MHLLKSTLNWYSPSMIIGPKNFDSRLFGIFFLDIVVFLLTALQIFGQWLKNMKNTKIYFQPFCKTYGSAYAVQISCFSLIFEKEDLHVPYKDNIFHSEIRICWSFSQIQPPKYGCLRIFKRANFITWLPGGRVCNCIKMKIILKFVPSRLLKSPIHDNN